MRFYSGSPAKSCLGILCQGLSGEPSSCKAEPSNLGLQESLYPLLLLAPLFLGFGHSLLGWMWFFRVAPRISWPSPFKLVGRWLSKPSTDRKPLSRCKLTVLTSRTSALPNSNSRFIHQDRPRTFPGCCQEQFQRSWVRRCFLDKICRQFELPFIPYDST